MNREKPVQVFRKDYQPSDFLIPEIFLDFELDDTDTRVQSQIHVVRSNRDDDKSPLVLNGINLKLESLAVDGIPLASSLWERSDKNLTIHGIRDKCCLTIVTRLDPLNNKTLEGLYKSGGIFCTQNEPQGFRKITYFLDRPDIMSRYTVKITADAKQYPVLLSNGNLKKRGRTADGRHWTLWEDPFPKPCYLFAIVAGNLGVIRDRFITRSKRRVNLRIYSEHGNEDRCRHAMRSLKNAMRWDEQRFNLECDLDYYSIVAVDSFNAGAMENKGLNIFNSHYVLANSNTATDSDYENIEAVIGHEYFHNWTGNRITCRDWFQLTLKEGLTVFRDQEFTSDNHSRAVKRIEDARHLRAVQFVEDAGPMSHPIRPDSYMEISNFYTATVYEKGAEVIRMIHTLLGEESFQNGIKRYIALFDGQAVTCDDFIRAMEEGGDADLSTFKLWYEKSGTPFVKITSVYDETTCKLTLTMEQIPSAGISQIATEPPLLIPMAIGLVGPDGKDIPAGPEYKSTILLRLNETRQEYIFENINASPVLSVNRGFSSPVRLETDRSMRDLLFLFAFDSDPFSRWDAGQTVCRHYLKSIIGNFTSGEEISVNNDFIEAYGAIIRDDSIDPSFKSLLLELPSETIIAQDYTPIDFNAIHHGRNIIKKTLGMIYQNEFISLYYENRIKGTYYYNAVDCGKRAIAALSLSYLCETNDPEMLDICYNHFKQSNNMTDQCNALAALNHSSSWQRNSAMDEFYRNWVKDPLVMMKWLTFQSTSRIQTTPDTVHRLENDPVYDPKIPNLVRALIGGFCTNYLHFHAVDGSGYRFISERITSIDNYNPSLASALTGAFKLYPRVDEKRRDLMKKELIRILEHTAISPNTFEVAMKTLNSIDKM